jgi:hypothetical protein
LAQAYQTIEDEKCPKCGVPIWHAYSEDNIIEFELDHIDCYACAHKDEAEEKEKKKTPGRTTFVKAKSALEDEPLPTREDFWRELAEKASKTK